MQNSCSPIFYLHTVCSRTRTRNPGFGYPQHGGEMGLRQVEQGFSSFFAKFLVYLMIFQNSVCQERGVCYDGEGSVKFKRALKPLQNFDKSSHMPKIWQKMKKSFVQHVLS